MDRELELSVFKDPNPSDKQHLDAFHKAQYNVMGDGVLSVSPEGVVLLSDRVIRQHLEIRPGSSLKDCLPHVWDRVEETLKDQKRRFELDVHRSGLDYLVTVSPILLDSEVVGAICVFAENTEIEAMAREMRSFKELSKELTVIINSSPEGLWVSDGEANVLRINAASERINNLKAAEVVGRNMKSLMEQGFLVRSATLEVIEQKKLVEMLETTKDGRKIIKTGIPVFNDDGNLIRVVVSERDVTEIDGLQRKLEEQAAISDHFQHQMLEMQQAELASIKVIAESPAMTRALKHAIKVSSADSSVLILGESGVGKGLFADLIHLRSKRAEKPLIKINCGAIPETLIESELFGHEKGAFTGAQSAKPGHLELADGGVLFLDEVAELPLSSQVKLLRFLEDGRVTRLGATKSQTVDVRILAATHRNLEEMVEQKEFRLDLYYRLNVIPLYIPALKERRDCILPLIRHYIDLFGKKNGLKKRLSGAALDVILAYSWPGNVRELMNICERLVVMSDTEVIDIQDLPQQIVGSINRTALPTKGMTLQQALDSHERSILAETMREYGNQYKTADILGVNQSTIARKIKKYGLG